MAFNPLEGWSRDASEDVAHEQEKQINRDRHERGLPSLPPRRRPRATP